MRQMTGTDVAERPPNTVEEELCGGHTLQRLYTLRGPTPLPPRPSFHQQMVPFPPTVKVEDRRRRGRKCIPPDAVDLS